MIRWLAFDIGCIECGEDSQVIGVYTTERAAKTACDEAAAEQAKHWHGEHWMQTFEIEVSND